MRIALIALAVMFLTPAPQTSLDSTLRAAQEGLMVPGMAVSIVEQGDITTLVYGQRNPQGDPVTPHTQFLLTAPTFTTTAVMQLADEGLIALDAPIGDYVPCLQQGVSVRAAMNHRGGFTAQAGRHLLASENLEAEAIDEAACALAGAPLAGEDAYTYSQANIVALGALIQNMTGVSYERYMADNIIEPFGMTGTFTRPDRADAFQVSPRIPEMAVGHRYWFGQTRPEAELLVPRVMMPIISTADDMALYMQRLLESMEPVGWQSTEIAGEHVVWQSGTAAHFTSIILLVPEREIGVTLLTNAASLTMSPRIQTVGFEAVENVLGASPQETAMPIEAPAYGGQVALITGGVLAWMGLSAGLLFSWRENLPPQGVQAVALKLGLPLVIDLGVAAAIIALVMPIDAFMLLQPDIATIHIVMTFIVLIWGATRAALTLPSDKRMVNL